jgi:hypothetical protein
MTKINLRSSVIFKKFKKWHRRKKFRQCGFAGRGPGASAKTASACALALAWYPRICARVGSTIYACVGSTRGTRAGAPAGARGLR